MCTSTYLRLKAACRLALYIAYKQTRRNFCFKTISCTYQDHLFDESCLKAFELTETLIDECTKFIVCVGGGGGSQQSLILQCMRSVFSIFVSTRMRMLGGGEGGRQLRDKKTQTRTRKQVQTTEDTKLEWSTPPPVLDGSHS